MGWTLQPNKLFGWHCHQHFLFSDVESRRHVSKNLIKYDKTRPRRNLNCNTYGSECFAKEMHSMNWGFGQNGSSIVSKMFSRGIAPNCQIAIVCLSLQWWAPFFARSLRMLRYLQIASFALRRLLDIWTSINYIAAPVIISVKCNQMYCAVHSLVFIDTIGRIKRTERQCCMPIHLPISATYLLEE